ncbi:hypothetical protein HPG69_003594 [Diceros bicornis minor]|uniref:Adaptin ear-binding coat-associated protein 1 n=1 Tax=Diceros bicornis minor TaxID=77932 RepID=A0A7J7EHC0_DICBM|nr:hypothetical protein HPG69_003594 [Diceros bicornis minor]
MASPGLTLSTKIRRVSSGFYSLWKPDKRLVPLKGLAKDLSKSGALGYQTVTDSSFYFVIWSQDDPGHSAFIGICFTDQGDAFDFNTPFQNHFKWVKQVPEMSKEPQEMDTHPKLELGFKERQIIKLRLQGTGGLSLLSTPPEGNVPIPPPSSEVTISNHVTPPPIPNLTMEAMSHISF